MGKKPSKKPKTKPEKQITESTAGEASEDNSSLEIKAPADEHTVFLRVKEAYGQAAKKRENYKKYGRALKVFLQQAFCATEIPNSKSTNH